MDVSRLSKQAEEVRPPSAQCLVSSYPADRVVVVVVVFAAAAAAAVVLLLVPCQFFWLGSRLRLLILLGRPSVVPT